MSDGPKSLKEIKVGDVVNVEIQSGHRDGLTIRVIITKLEAGGAFKFKVHPEDIAKLDSNQ